jgi:preprotein translocase subunit SecE
MAEEVKGASAKGKFSNTRIKLVRFFKDIKSELKRVVWPSRTQLINNTITVLLTCLLVGSIIWVVDAGLNVLRNLVLGI